MDSQTGDLRHADDRTSTVLDEEPRRDWPVEVKPCVTVDPPNHAYEQLPHDRCIRLLKIIPAFGIAGPDPWSVDLQVFDLEDCEPYTALSYTWGPPIMPEQYFVDGGCSEEDLAHFHRHPSYDVEPLYESAVDITCNTSRLSIPRNLFDFLDEYHRRSTSTGSPSGYIWADAICIQQSDLHERSTQVALMGEIYTAANATILWLGKNSTDLGSVDTFINSEFYDRITQMDQTEAREKGLPRSEKDLQDFGLHITPIEWSEQWNIFFRFFERRNYFYRAWVFQECALAGQINIRCGIAEVNGTKLKIFLNALVDAGWAWQTDLFRQIGYYSNFPSIFKLSMANLGYTVQKLPQYPVDNLDTTAHHRWYGYLSYLLDRIRLSLCADPRDKVYAIAGLANKVAPRGLALEADYTRHVHDVYRDIARDVILNRPGLMTLYHVEEIVDDEEEECSLAGKNASLPSWVPDFNVTWPLGKIPFTACFDVSKGLDLYAHPTPVVTGTALSVTGACFDVIRNVSPPGRLTVDSFQEVRSALPNSYKHTNQPIEEALWRTMILDIVWNAPIGRVDYPAADNFVHNFHAWLEYGPKVREEQRSQENTSSAQGSVKAAIYDTAIRWAGSQYHRLFFTSRGCIGRGPQCMGPGDQIFLLLGARTPFVLRRIADTTNYTFLGHVYVHGFMQGEMVEAVRDRLGPVYIV